jgi:hypothetical protein
MKTSISVAATTDQTHRLSAARHFTGSIRLFGCVISCSAGDIELACAERVVKRMSADDKKAVFKRLLLTCSVDRPVLSPACPLAFGEVGVKQRITKRVELQKAHVLDHHRGIGLLRPSWRCAF